MAVGDTVITHGVIAALAVLTYQPAAGVEAIITTLGSDVWQGVTPDQNPDIDVFIVDAGGSSLIINDTFSPHLFRRLKVFVTNTRYIRLSNQAAGNAVLCMQGIQIK